MLAGSSQMDATASDSDSDDYRSKHHKSSENGWHVVHITPQLLTRACGGELNTVIQTLDLSADTIRLGRIQHLEQLQPFQSLVSINVANNNLEDVSHLATLPKLRHVDVRGNRLRSIAPLCQLRFLETLDAEQNAIQALPPQTSQLRHLRELLLADNQISTLASLHPLRHLTNLATLSLEGNPVDRLPQYTTYLLFLSPFLHIVDGSSVTDAQREIVASQYDVFRAALDQPLPAQAQAPLSSETQDDIDKARSQEAVEKIASLESQCHKLESNVQRLEAEVLRLTEQLDDRQMTILELEDELRQVPSFSAVISAAEDAHEQSTTSAGRNASWTLQSSLDNAAQAPPLTPETRQCSTQTDGAALSKDYTTEAERAAIAALVSVAEELHLHQQDKSSQAHAQAHNAEQERVLELQHKEVAEELESAEAEMYRLQQVLRQEQQEYAKIEVDVDGFGQEESAAALEHLTQTRRQLRDARRMVNELQNREADVVSRLASLRLLRAQAFSASQSASAGSPQRHTEQKPCDMFVPSETVNRLQYAVRHLKRLMQDEQPQPPQNRSESGKNITARDLRPSKVVTTTVLHQTSTSGPEQRKQENLRRSGAVVIDIASTASAPATQSLATQTDADLQTVDSHVQTWKAAMEAVADLLKLLAQSTERHDDLPTMSASALELFLESLNQTHETDDAPEPSYLPHLQSLLSDVMSSTDQLSVTLQQRSPMMQDSACQTDALSDSRSIDDTVVSVDDSPRHTSDSDAVPTSVNPIDQSVHMATDGLSGVAWSDDSSSAAMLGALGLVDDGEDDSDLSFSLNAEAFRDLSLSQQHENTAGSSPSSPLTRRHIHARSSEQINQALSQELAAVELLSSRQRLEDTSTQLRDDLAVFETLVQSHEQSVLKLCHIAEGWACRTQTEQSDGSSHVPLQQGANSTLTSLAIYQKTFAKLAADLACNLRALRGRLETQEPEQKL